MRCLSIAPHDIQTRCGGNWRLPHAVHSEPINANFQSWFRAAAGADGAIALRDSLEAKMSPEQIDKAQDMSQEWNNFSQINDHKFFPDWIREPPEYTFLKEEANAKRLNKTIGDEIPLKQLLRFLRAN